MAKWTLLARWNNPSNTRHPMYTPLTTRSTTQESQTTRRCRPSPTRTPMAAALVNSCGSREATHQPNLDQRSRVCSSLPHAHYTVQETRVLLLPYRYPEHPHFFPGAVNGIGAASRGLPAPPQGREPTPTGVHAMWTNTINKLQKKEANAYVVTRNCKILLSKFITNIQWQSIYNTQIHWTKPIVVSQVPKYLCRFHPCNG